MVGQLSSLRLVNAPSHWGSPSVGSVLFPDRSSWVATLDSRIRWHTLWLYEQTLLCAAQNVPLRMCRVLCRVPISESNSRLVQHFRPCQKLVDSFRCWSLSAGRHSCIRDVSTSFPRMVREIAGPSHLSGSIGASRAVKVFMAVAKLRAQSGD